MLSYGIGCYARLAIGYYPSPLCGIVGWDWGMRSYGIDGYVRVAIGYDPTPLRGIEEYPISHGVARV